YSEAKNDESWVAAMKEELFMNEKNKTWELVDQPQDRKHKARLVVKGYAQIFGVDYFDTFAPKVYQMDVKSAFLNRFLQEEIYVDQPEGFANFKQEMMQAFEMTDLGLMSYFLGMEIKQGQNEVFICQKKYAKEILKKFNMEDCKEMGTPMNQKEKLSKNDGADKVEEAYFRSLVSCLMYLTATRPDILYAVSIYQGSCIVPVRKILGDLHMKQTEGNEVFVDNQVAIAISHNPVFHGKTKHFNIKFFFLRDVQKNGDVTLLYCKTEEQLADIFTKSFSSNKFELLRKKL
ncbi:putative mitochondrial protein, partial [Nicotiana attenuata]